MDDNVVAKITSANNTLSWNFMKYSELTFSGTQDCDTGGKNKKPQSDNLSNVSLCLMWIHEELLS